MRLYVLAKSHREVQGVRECVCCRRWKTRTARIVVYGANGDVTEVEICSGCSQAMHDIAVEGRKVR